MRDFALLNAARKDGPLSNRFCGRPSAILQFPFRGSISKPVNDGPLGDTASSTKSLVLLWGIPHLQLVLGLACWRLLDSHFSLSTAWSGSSVIQIEIEHFKESFLRTMKRIIVCCDGTSNSAYQSREDSPRTNVFRISNYIKPVASDKTRQIVLYQPGVGAVPGLSRLWKQAWGIGIGVNIMATYHFICLNYEDGDEIIMIGYSRGAFTVRCIINLINEIGLLSRRGLANLHPVFDCWWKNKTRQELDEKLTYLGRHDWHPGPISIKVCGLWDTVNSVGRAGIFGPGSSLGIKRGGIPSRVTATPLNGVENVFHALSLHERRSLFQPEIANVVDHETQRLEQCWFSGYHGDIGGGRPDDVLAHLSLTWMMGKLHPFIDFDRSIFYQGEMIPLSKRIRMESTSSGTGRWRLSVPDTMTPSWRLTGKANRRPGTIAEIPDTKERVHWSVFSLTAQFRALQQPSEQVNDHDLLIDMLTKPCWLFKNVSLDSLRANPRHWRHNYTKPADRIIQETERHGIETNLIQSWSADRLRALQDNSTPNGVGEPNLLFMMLSREIF